MSTPSYSEDAKYIQGSLDHLQESDKRNDDVIKELKESIRRVEEDMSVLDESNKELLNIIHNLGTEYKLEMSKITTRLGLYTGIFVTVATILTETFLSGYFNKFFT